LGYKPQAYGGKVEEGSDERNIPNMSGPQQPISRIHSLQAHKVLPYSRVVRCITRVVDMNGGGVNIEKGGSRD
jgi:hypothetical protein